MLLSSTPQGQLEHWAYRAQRALRTATHHVSIDDLGRGITKMAAHALQTAAWKREVNAKNAFAMLPATLLGRILREQLLTHDILAVSQTCSRLRSVMLEFPEFWIHQPVILRQGQLCLQRLVIQRSGSAPLEMRLYVAGTADPPGWTDDCCQIAAENLDRISRLMLITEVDASPPVFSDAWGLLRLSDTWGLSRVEDPEWDAISRALEHAAPLLHEFVLYRGIYMPPRPLVLPSKLFNDEAPLLRSCILNGVILPDPLYLVFKNLVSLHYHAWHDSPALQLEVIIRMLDDLPSLEFLCLSGHQLVSESDIEDTHPRRANPKRASITVRITSVRYGSLEFGRVHNLLCAYGVQKFEYEYEGTPNEFVDSDNIIQACTPVEWMGVRPSHVEYCSGSTSVFVRQQFWTGPFLLGNPRAYARLASLTLDECYWPESFVLPAAPCLTSLCVVLGSCADFRSHAGSTMPFNSGTCSVFNAEHPWLCPALRSVHLAYRPPEKYRRCREYYDWDEPDALPCCCAETLTVSYRDTHHFITTCLRFEGDRIALFKMSGVEPIDPHCQDLLFTVAEDVQISSTVDAAAVAQAQWHACDGW